MKTRNGFVSNSSSSSFIATYLADSDMLLTDIIKNNLRDLCYKFYLEDISKKCIDKGVDIFEKNNYSYIDEECDLYDDMEWYDLPKFLNSIHDILKSDKNKKIKVGDIVCLYIKTGDDVDIINIKLVKEIPGKFVVSDID